MRTLYKLDLNQFEDFELEEIGRNILQSAEGNAWDCIDLINNFDEEKNIKFHDINIIRGIINEVFVNENNYFRYKINSARHVLLLIHKCPNHEKILNGLLLNIELSLPKNDDFINFNMAKHHLRRLKAKNILISQDIDLIISSLNKAICNSINAIFDEDYKQILTYNNFRTLNPYVFKCLNETKRKCFSNLAYDEPLDFIRFFSKISRHVENHENKIKVEIRWHLFEKFINPINLKEYIEEISLDDLSKSDKAIIEEFLNNISN